MKLYKKNISGVTIVKRPKEIIIYKNNKAIYNPKEQQILEDGWVEYIKSAKKESPHLYENA